MAIGDSLISEEMAQQMLDQKNSQHVVIPLCIDDTRHWSCWNDGLNEWPNDIFSCEAPPNDDFWRIHRNFLT